MTRREWTPEERARAVELYRTVNLAAAFAETGIPKSTIRAWANGTRGADGDGARAREETKSARDKARANLEAANTARAERLETERLELSGQLLRRLTAPAAELIARRLESAAEEERLVDAARQRWSDALESVKLAASMGAEEEAKALKAARAAEAGYRLATGRRMDVRDLVGIVTRAIHDHLTLEGLAGDDQAAGDIVLELGVPTAADPAGARAGIARAEDLAAAAEGPASGERRAS